MQKSLRVLVFGDSLSLPRTRPERVLYKETWPALLKENQNIELHQISIGGATLKILYEQMSYYLPMNPDIVIIQTGIVDCAPRAIGFIEKQIIANNRFLNYFVRKFYPYDYMRQLRNLTYTSANGFNDIITNIKSDLNTTKLIWIGIAPVSFQYEKKIPGIRKNVYIYNSILKAKLTGEHEVFISLDSFPEEGLMSDYHHLNKIGHKWISQRIQEIWKF